MGITILNGLFLTEAWQQGARFGEALTLGRQDLFLSPRDYDRLARLLPAESEFARGVRERRYPSHAEPLLAAMGATRIDSIDASDFEGATVVHDLNQPLPSELHGRYDAIVDGGTLEHVFNVATAFANVMRALRVGGQFFACLPANNQCGHGFYQFGADFFYRTFAPVNGFRMRGLYVAPVYIAGRWVDGPVFEVVDPAESRTGRVQIEGRRQTVFLVHAEKVADVEPFAAWPQQFDYTVRWNRSGPSEERAPAFQTAKRWLHRAAGVGRRLRRIRERRRWDATSAANGDLRRHRWPDETA